MWYGVVFLVGILVGIYLGNASFRKRLNKALADAVKPRQKKEKE